MRIAIILYCLLSAIINVPAAENVTPGKYFCVVSDAVDLETKRQYSSEIWRCNRSTSREAKVLHYH